jgi:DNA-binding NarL/FixJ family response regulator
MNSTIKVYIADDHPIIRKGLKELIAEHDHIEWIGEGNNGLEAYNQIKELEPSVAILDIDMPVMSGLDVCKKLISEKNFTRLVVLTMHKEEGFYHDAMQIGIHGYLIKESLLSDLADCIQQVHKGGTYTSPAMSKYLKTTQQEVNKEDWMKKFNLTPSEINVLKFVKQGKTNKEIAGLLFVSEKAIEAHRTNCIRKLGIEPGKNALMKFLLETQNHRL